MINKIEVGILPYHYPSYFFRRKDTAYVKNMRVNNISPNGGGN